MVYAQRVYFGLSYQRFAQNRTQDAGRWNSNTEIKQRLIIIIIIIIIINGKHATKELQKTAILGTAHMLSEVLLVYSFLSNNMNILLLLRHTVITTYTYRLLTQYSSVNLHMFAVKFVQSHNYIYLFFSCFYESSVLVRNDFLTLDRENKRSEKHCSRKPTFHPPADGWMERSGGTIIKRVKPKCWEKNQSGCPFVHQILCALPWNWNWTPRWESSS